jgi:hypothetical protein
MEAPNKFEPVDIKTILTNRANWPQCPQCSEKMMISFKEVVCCANCSWSGPISEISKSKAFRALVMDDFVGRDFASTYGHFLAPEAELESEENMRALGCVVDQISFYHMMDDLVRGHMSYAEKSKVSYKRSVILGLRMPGGSEEALSLSEFEAETPQELQMHLKRTAEKLRAAHLLCGAIYLTPETASVDKDKFIFFASMAGNPTRAVMIDDGKNMRVPLSNCPLSFISKPIPNGMPELLWQRTDWANLPIKVGEIQPRYLAVVHLDDNINVNFYVAENMDGGCIARVSTRTPGTYGAAQVTEIPAESAGDAIKTIRERYSRVLDTIKKKGLKPSSSFEIEWDIAKNTWAIPAEIRAKLNAKD